MGTLTEGGARAPGIQNGRIGRRGRRRGVGVGRRPICCGLRSARVRSWNGAGTSAVAGSSALQPEVATVAP